MNKNQFNKVDAYEFGRIVISGKLFMRDVIVSADKIKERSCRSSHLMDQDQLKEVLALNPRVIVIGTGESGVMKLEEGIEKSVKDQGIELIIAPTSMAVRSFNQLLEQGKKAVALLHLTC